MKVCVYTICKNEINNINQWIECMCVADYMVILDTGSTDGTWEELLKLRKKHYNLILYKHIFENFRFDDARNMAKEYIPKDTDICVSMDIDETFKNKNWCKYLKSKWNKNYKIGTLIYLDNKENNIYNKKLALPRTKIHTLDCIWKYPLHEIIVYDKNAKFNEYGLENNQILNIWDIDLREENWDSLIVYHKSHKSDSPIYKNLSILRYEEYKDNTSLFIMVDEYFKSKEYDKVYEIIANNLDVKELYFYKGWIEKYIYKDNKKAIISFEENLKNTIDIKSAYELLNCYISSRQLLKLKELVNKYLDNYFYSTRFQRYVKNIDEFNSFLYNEFIRYKNMIK